MNVNHVLIDKLVQSCLTLGTLTNLKELLEDGNVVLEDGGPSTDDAMEALQYKIAVMVLEIETAANEILDKMTLNDLDLEVDLPYN